MGAGTAEDGRVSTQPVADKGFASVRNREGRIRHDFRSIEGLETVSTGVHHRNRRRLAHRASVPCRRPFQHTVLRQVSAAPVRAALDTHYHFDHLGNAFYGTQGIPIWAHEKTAPSW
jgi:hypothetical protein